MLPALLGKAGRQLVACWLGSPVTTVRYPGVLQASVASHVDRDCGVKHGNSACNNVEWSIFLW